MAEIFLICGVDEAGRGPLAGPVVAAAVIFDPARPVAGVADSKLLTASRRAQLETEIKSKALAWAVAQASAGEIDRINILRATLLAMQRSVEALSVTPEQVLIDGLHCPELACPSRAIVRGDESIAVISAASILAKTARDREMLLLHQRYPQYGFDHHKGYPTPAHLEALRRHGICDVHRRSFAPVKRLIERQGPETTADCAGAAKTLRRAV